MPCSAYTCLDVCKKSFTYLQYFCRYLGKCRVAPFFGPPGIYNNRFSDVLDKSNSNIFITDADAACADLYLCKTAYIFQTSHD